MTELLIAFRNLGRNRRRSLFTLLTVAMGFAAVNLFAGYVNDVYEGLSRQAVHGELLGHLQVRMAGDRAERRLNPEEFVFSRDQLQRLEQIIREDPDVDLVTPRLELSGLVSEGRVSTIFIGEGMVPEHTSRIRAGLGDGRSPDLLMADKGAAGAFGAGLAEILGVREGDYTVLVGATLDGMTNALDLDVGSIFDTGTEATNERLVLMPIETARRLLATEGADRLVILLHERDRTDVVMARLGEALSGFESDVEISNWRELSVFYQRVRDLFDMIFMFIFSIVVLIVVMSIVNIMSLVVMERTREIGTLQAIGMKRSAILRLFCSEGTILAVLGCVSGVVLVVLAATLVNGAGISYTPPNATDVVPLRVELQSSTMLVSAGVMAVLVALATLLPARRATRMSITEALGHV